ncbi:MAG: excinuclease ABC subunit UvrC [Propionibacteriaceae bacterium]|jgi:excinuclease ABC subunit C|nr:excinuclease ABC subunit UvrC [Propionibacteriaceae bacterium]
MADPAAYRPKPGEIPTNPGVYRFLDAEGRVIYVGKAINLRSRLNSYFQDVAALHFRTQTMVRTAAKVEWTIVRNELEALQLEYTWIQQFQPRFNIKYRDDKSYPWAAVTWGEEFPRVFVGRGAKRKGNRYFGPYAQAWAIRQTIDSLLMVFPMRSCTDGVFANARRSGRPCLLGHIGKCAAPCVGRISEADHRALVVDLCEFLAGRTAGLIKQLEAAMNQAAEALEFEQAALLRDRLQALQSVAEKNAVVLGDGTDADVVALAEDPLEVAVAIFHVRGGRVRGERSWVADRSDDAAADGLMESFLLQAYSDADVPPEILVSALPSSVEVLTELLAEARGAKVRVRVPRRGDKKALLETVAQNAAQVLALHKTKRASDLSTRNRALEEIQEALGLPTAPLRIECYDISHLQGTDVVASMVVFEDGLARKSDYRRFVLKNQESNDVGAMREVITRRFTRLLADRGDDGLLIDPATGAPRRFAYAPGLVVVDGGAPQVAAAQSALAELGIYDVALCGLAKRLEEVWVPGEEWPVILPRNSEGLYLLQRIRDEAHRFAITHHRSRRSKSMLETTLDEVPGLGDARRKALLKYFPSLKKLRAASPDELAQVPGIGPKLAADLASALAGQQPAPAIDMETGEIF